MAETFCLLMSVYKSFVNDSPSWVSATIMPEEKVVVVSQPTRVEITALENDVRKNGKELASSFDP